MLGITVLSGCETPPKDGSCTISTLGVLPLYTSHHSPVVKATINKQPVLFEVDTGAFNSVLSKQYAKKFDVTYASSMVRAVGAKGTEFQHVVQVDDIGLGGATNTNHAFTLTSLQFEPTRPPLPPLVGLLGAEILLASDLVIDMPHHNMQLLDMRQCPYPAPLWKGTMHVIPIDRNLDDMKLHLHFTLDGGAPIRAVFDTGASHTVLPIRIAHRLGVTDEMLKKDPSTTNFSAIGDDKTTVYRHHFKTMTLGDFTISDPEILINDNDILDYALFGADFLRQHRVWITTGKVMYVQHVSEIPPGNMDQPSVR